MKGYWLTRNDGCFATHQSPYGFDKLSKTCARRGEGHKKKYFVPQTECTPQFRQKNIPVEEELDDILDELNTSVDFTQDEVDPQMQSLNKEYKKARIKKTLADTKLTGQRLQERKRQLFYDWSERFFNSFADHFGKLKNCLVQMHLNQQQIKVFNQTLDKCMENMELDLNNIFEEFKQEKENEN